MKRMITLVLLACVAGAVGFASAATSEPGSSVERFDPVSEVLKIRTPADGKRMAEAQKSIDAVAASDPVAAARIQGIRDSFWMAIDDLYAEAAASDDAVPAQSQWRSCMAKAGIPAWSPPEAEAQRSRMTTTQRARSIDAQERCEVESDRLFAPALRRAYTPWYAAHREAIAAFQELYD